MSTVAKRLRSAGDFKLALLQSGALWIEDPLKKEDNAEIRVLTDGPNTPNVTIKAGWNFDEAVLCRLGLDVSGAPFSVAAASNTVINSNLIQMGNLPTSDPSSAGQLWNDSGTVKVSAG